MPGPLAQSFSSCSPATGRLYSLPISLYSWAASSPAGFFPEAGCGAVSFWGEGGRGTHHEDSRTWGQRGEVFRPASSPLWTHHCAL